MIVLKRVWHRFVSGHTLPWSLLLPFPFWLTLTLLLAAGCGKSGGSAPAVAARKKAPADPWLLTDLDPSNETPALLWNGKVGVRFGRDGGGTGPLFLIGSYQKTGEEKIEPLQNPLEGGWDAGASAEHLSPSESSDYQQTLDMRTGVLTTAWTQTVEGKRVQVKCESVLSTDRPLFGQRWTITSDGYLELLYRSRMSTSTANLRGNGQFVWPVQGPSPAIAEADTVGKDIRRQDPKADMNSEWMAGNGPLAVTAASDRGQPFRFDRVLDFGGGSAIPTLGFDQILRESESAWKNRWQTDIEIDGPVEDQQAVRSFLFYLRSAIADDGKMSVSPFGLSSADYNGHVFWDADIWVFPALALIAPEKAAAIADYRLRMRGPAHDNFEQWLAGGRPTASGALGPVNMKGAAFGYKYPWESSVTGHETVPGPSKFEEHISGDVVWMLGQAAALGLCPAKDAEVVREGVASYYRYRAPGGAMSGVMSPDESHVGSNDLYTNLLATWCVNGGGWGDRGLDARSTAGPAGDTHARAERATAGDTHARAERATFMLPKDEKSFLTYDNDPLRGYKQAAAVLSIYPLQYPPAEAQAKTMMDRFADKVIKNGPAMTDSVHALIWARLGESDKAYDTWRKSWMEFVKEPLMQFSEKRNKPKTYFTTGAGGCLQTVLFGFLGFRIDSKKQEGAGWSTNLALGQVLSVRPNLPKSWKSVKLKNFTVLGRRYTLIATHPDADGQGGVQVIQGDQ